jgi:hypothetical protein
MRKPSSWLNCQPIHSRGCVRPCIGSVVTRFLPLQVPDGVTSVSIMTPEAWRAAIASPASPSQNKRATRLHLMTRAMSLLWRSLSPHPPSKVLASAVDWMAFCAKRCISCASAGQLESWSSLPNILQGLSNHNVNQRSNVTISRALALFGHHAILTT